MIALYQVYFIKLLKPYHTCLSILASSVHVIASVAFDMNDCTEQGRNLSIL